MKGKLVTSTQYTNWMTPERTRKKRKESMNFRREGVVSRYAFQRECRATEDGADGVGLVDEGVCLVVLDDDFGPAILVRLQ